MLKAIVSIGCLVMVLLCFIIVAIIMFIECLLKIERDWKNGTDEELEEWDR